METNKITLMDAYVIETLRSKGMSNEQLIMDLEQKNLDALKNINANYDYNDLLTLYEQDKSAFTSILTDGYEVKFVTMGGLKGLLELKFDKIADRDYTLTDKGIEHLEMEEHQLHVLNQLLSRNWTIEQSPSKEISVKLM
ncbi:hypothetical protein H9649_08005 [Sporosarcina sp. Sa2YVA2]|uniref:Uncharacterized protein n=1 Tax=Sporosarcina quadrami TaxID=2762234 RepID=A0ABR8U911_9BACL|nr:hypothetical protein [Sporosarcina quadrami]MBD7984519.1 hypothetical protein [Sporosarcina quadrami]